MSGSTDGGMSLDNDAVGAPPARLDVIILTNQFASERLHGGHMPNQVNNGAANDVIPLTQLGAMFWAWSVSRAGGQLSGAVHDEWAFLALLLNCRSDSAAAHLMVLDGIGKAVRQRLKMVLCIDLPVLSASYSKSGAFAACKYVRPRYDGAGVEVEPIADLQAVIDGGHSSSGRIIHPSTRLSGGSTWAKKPPVVTHLLKVLSSRMLLLAYSGRQHLVTRPAPQLSSIVSTHYHLHKVRLFCMSNLIICIASCKMLSC